MPTKSRKLVISSIKPCSNNRTYWVSTPKTSLPHNDSPLTKMKTRTKTTLWVAVAWAVTKTTAISIDDSTKKRSTTWKWKRTETATMMKGPTGGHNSNGRTGTISIGGLSRTRSMKMRRTGMSCCNSIEIIAINMRKKRKVGLRMNRLSRWQHSKQPISWCLLGSITRGSCLNRRSIKKKTTKMMMKIYTKRMMKMKRKMSRGKRKQAYNKIKKRKSRARANYKSIWGMSSGAEVIVLRLLH